MRQRDSHAEENGASNDRSEDLASNAGHVRLPQFDDWRLGPSRAYCCAAAHLPVIGAGRGRIARLLQERFGAK